LDALLRGQMRVEIRRIQRAGQIPAIYVTHDRVEAMSLSDRVIVMKDGEIVEQGTVEDIFEHPQHPYTRQLLKAAE
ncbi:MAG: ABC transporter ATP-binding protein, partial [Clostridia bacterium]|nr:ABC transporter ATP-binding protein [Clostridia bacterium]